MPNEINTQVRLAARPRGMPKTSDFAIGPGEIPALADGQVLVAVDYISLDPAMRGWMNEGRSYIQGVALGDVMRAGGVGHVVASRHPGLHEGDHVVGTTGVQSFAVLDGREARKIDPALAPLPTWLGALGMPGMTAYFGLLDVGQAEPGETVVVSAASGAVGAVVGQVARAIGARAVGLAGGPGKCGYVRDELGFDACIDYKSEDVPAALRTHCAQGIDVYFDNVGGAILDAAMARLARHARVVVCGAISQYNALETPRGPANYLSLLVNRARMEGFVVFDYADRYEEGARRIAGWIAEGKLKTREHVVDGIETFPDTLLKLFTGENFGKLVIRVAHG